MGVAMRGRGRRREGGGENNCDGKRYFCFAEHVRISWLSWFWLVVLRGQLARGSRAKAAGGHTGGDRKTPILFPANDG